MKRFAFNLWTLFLLLGLISCASRSANTAVENSVGKETTSISFEKTSHDFGAVVDGEKVTYSFKFSNTGNNDLEIQNVGTSCGCTASDYTKGLIKPGEKGRIQVTFNSSHRTGMQNKTISVKANTQPETTVLNIQAQVVDKEIN
ncbi:MAG: DUF1573 domain-containing protein [Bacteroidales bacterium]|nr:DUF1573 domain-containing protein [Bacteroidales bacterium]